MSFVLLLAGQWVEFRNLKVGILNTLFSSLPADTVYLLSHHRTSSTGMPRSIFHNLKLVQPGLCQTCSQHKSQSLAEAIQYPCQPHEKPTRNKERILQINVKFGISSSLLKLSFRAYFHSGEIS